MKKLEPAVVVLLLVFFAGICFKSQQWSSVTVDEFAHLPAGYHYWRTGDYSLYGENPPLVKLIASLPWLVWKPSADLELSQWPRSNWLPWLYGTDFMLRNRAAYRGLFQAGRMMIILLGAMLGLILYGYARALYGRTGALLSLAVFALCPNLIAHSGLATVDTGAALFIFLALLALIHYLKKPGWLRALCAGLVLGLAELSKFSALPLVIFYALAPVLTIRPFKSDPPRAKRVLLRSAQTGLMLLAGLFIIAAGYRFQGLFKSAGACKFDSRRFQQIQKYASALPAPFPEYYLSGLDRQLKDLESEQFQNFLLGKWYRGADPRYFLVTLLVKTPLPILILFLLGLLARPGAGAPPRRFAPEEILILAVMFWLLFLFSFGNTIQIGIRYLLPLLPLGYLLIGRIGKPGAGQWRKIPAAALWVWLLVGGLRAYPHYLSYFNELAGGPGNGHQVLLDSNLDWGQDLPALSVFMKKNQIDKIELWYFGEALPELYGVNYQLLGEGPRLEYSAISAQFYYSGGRLYHPLFYYQPERIFPLNAARERANPVALDQSRLLPYLGQKPAATCGYSILVFRNY